MLEKFKWKFFHYRKIVKQHYLFYRIRKRKLYFIVSTGRTGTNFFESFLNSASDSVYCVHEPSPDLFDISLNKLRFGHDSSTIVRQIKNTRVSILKDFINSGKLTYIESNPFAAFLIPEIKQAFPKAKFIFIFRDLDTYLLSALNKSPANNGVNNFYADDDGRKRINALDFKNDVYADQWNEFSRSQKIAWYWDKCNKYLLEYSQKNASNILSLKFDDFFSSNKEVKKTKILEVLKFLNISISKDKLEELLSESSKRKNETKEQFFSDINEISKDEMSFVHKMTEETSKRINEHTKTHR